MILLLDAVDSSPDGIRTASLRIKHCGLPRKKFLRALHSFSKKKDKGMLIRSKYRACVEWEYKSKRTLVTSFTFSVSILHKRYTALNVHRFE